MRKRADNRLYPVRISESKVGVWVDIATRYGVYAAIVTENGVARIFFPGRTRTRAEGVRVIADGCAAAADGGVEWCRSQAAAALAARVAEAVRAYHAGTLRAFTVSVDLAAAGHTDFQQRIWQELVRVPYGETISYGELARRAGSPRAARAAGSACGANPVPIIIPCHRILAAGARLGGFGGGLARKRKLLRLENISWQE